MTAGPAVADPTLYQILNLALWSPLEPPHLSDQRIAATEKTLRLLRYAPPGAQLPARSESGWRTVLQWNEWSEKQEGFAVHRFASSFRETLTVFLGIEEDGPHPWPPERWVGRACRFAQAQGWAPISADLVPAKLVAGTPWLLGCSWLWTGEWEEPPACGWEAFGRQRYGEQEGCVLFPWGLLGHDTRTGDRFDLHTDRAEEHKAARDAFLFNELVAILGEYLKVTQDLMPRYDGRFAVPLNDATTRITTIVGRQEVEQATEKTVRGLADLLFPYSRTLAELEYDIRGTTIARDQIAESFQRAGGAIVGGRRGTLLLGPVDWFARQAASDLAYYRSTEHLGRTALQAEQIIVQENQTRAEHEVAQGHIRLAVLGIFFAAGFGVLQVLLALPAFTGLPGAVRVLLDLGISSLVGLAGVGLYFAWETIFGGLGALLPGKHRRRRTEHRDQTHRNAAG